MKDRIAESSFNEEKCPGNENCTEYITERYSCRLVPNDSGNPKRLCERTRRVLRECLGRAPEVIEYSSEKTEDSQPLSISTTDGTTMSYTSSFTSGENNILTDSLRKVWDEGENQLKDFMSVLPTQERLEESRQIMNTKFDDLVLTGQDLIRKVFDDMKNRKKDESQGEKDTSRLSRSTHDEFKDSAKP